MKKWAIGIAVFVVALTIIFGWRPTQHSEPPLTKDMPIPDIKVTSSAFPDNGIIPAQFTCDVGSPAGGMSPPIEISGLPTNTKTLALIMHDPDAPREGGWTHWVKWNMPWNMEYGTWRTEEGKEPSGVSGKGSGGTTTYQGPCPPSGTHRYFFTIYALDSELLLKEGGTKTELESAMNGHILAKGELIGLYARRQ